MAIQKKIKAFNDGVVSIYSTKETSENGMMPKTDLTLKKTLRFNERIVGINRYYQALQSNAKISRLIRCLRTDGISVQDTAVINNKAYRISFIQYPDVENRKVMDLTLEKLEADFDVDG